MANTNTTKPIEWYGEGNPLIIYWETFVPPFQIDFLQDFTADILYVVYGLTLLWIPGLIPIVAIQTALTGIIFLYALIYLLGVLNNKETDPMSREKFSVYVWIWFPFRRFIVQLFLDIILRFT